MSELVKPVIEDLIKQGASTGNFQFTQPIHLQIVKFRVVDAQRYIRVSDGKWSIGLTSNELDESFLEMNRIVKITNFLIKRVVQDTSSRVFLDIRGWEDQGPSNSFIGKPANLKTQHVDSMVDISLIPVWSSQDDEEPQQPDAHHLSSTSTNQSAAPSRTTSTTSAPSAARAGEAPGTITIEAVSPYINQWKILARCTKKSDIREFKYKDRPESGKMFKITLTDETGDIEATGFSEAVTQFYDKIHEGQQYYVSNMAVREANKRFSTSSHDFELAFSRDSKFEPAMNTNVKLPSVFFKFVSSLEDLSKHEVNSTVDVVGVLSQIFDVQTITSKTTNVPYTKRDVELVDDSNKQVKLTVWGADAENFNYKPGTVLAIKAARLSDFGGISLSATRNSKLVTDLDEPRAHKLKGWYEAVGSTSNDFTSVADSSMAGSANKNKSNDKRVTINQIMDNQLGRSEKSEYFTLKARVSQVFNRMVAYPACSLGDCKKKVIQESDGWRCEKCDQTMPEPQWRYVMSMLIADASSDEMGLSISVFDQVGRVLYGDRAAEFHHLHELNEQGVSSGMNSDLNRALRSIQGEEYIWKIEGRLEKYNDQERPRYQAISASKVDQFKESELMLGEMGF